MSYLYPPFNHNFGLLHYTDIIMDYFNACNKTINQLSTYIYFCTLVSFNIVKFVKSIGFIQSSNGIKKNLGPDMFSVKIL